MGSFNRGDRGGGRDFSRRPSFGDRRSERGPVEMHRAVCDKCHKDCEVPFRPTSGKPIYCKNCFESNRESDSRRPEGRNFDRPASFEDSPRFAGEAGRQMFEAVCDNCRNNCKVPFQPRGDKPIFCSNCFEAKNAGENRDNGKPQSQSQYREQFEALNNKLDKILKLLSPEAFVEVAKEIEAKVSSQPAELKVKAVKKPKVKKSSSKKK